MSEKPTHTRRGVLKKVGAGAFLPLGNLARKQEETVKLPELRDHKGVVKWMEVPKVWDVQRRRAERVSSNLKQRFANDAGVVEVGLIAAPEQFGGKRGLQVEIGVNRDKLTSEIPDHVDDVPVQTVEKEEPPVPLCMNDNYSGLPGGVKIFDDNDSSYSVGSTGWKVKVNGVECMMTAAHVVSGTTNVYGDPDWTGTPQKVGEVYQRESTSTLDAAAIESSRSIPNKIIGDGSTYPIGGWVTEEGISSRVSDWFDGYRKMGITTGETTGGLGKYHIDDSYHSSTPSYEGHGVRGDADAASGDSGGAAFSLHNGGEAFITHMITHGDPKAGQYSSNSNCYNVNPYKKSIGPAAYHLNGTYEIQGSSRS